MLYEISLPQSIKLNVKSTNKVIRLHKMKGIQGIKSAIDSIVTFYTQNSKAIYIELTELQDLHDIYNLRYKNIGIVYRFKEKDLESLKSYETIFKAYEVKVIIDDCKTENLSFVIQTLTNYDVEVELTHKMISKLNQSDWEILTKEIILNSQIVQKVEPFFSMAYYQYQKKIGQKTAATLWKVFGDGLGERLYVGEDGNIALSKRWSDEKRYFGTLDDDSSKLYESEFYEQLNKQEQNIFFTNMNCAMCDHFGYCKAYMKFENSDYDCTAFKLALDELGKNLDQFKKVA